MNETPEQIHIQEPLPPPRQTFLERHGISPVMFGVLALIVAFFSYEILGSVIAYFLVGETPTPQNVNAFRAVTGVSQFVFLLVPTLLLVRLATFSPLEYLRIRTPDWRTLLIPLVGVYSLQQMLQIYLFVQEKIPVPEEMQSYLEKYKHLIEQAMGVMVGASSIPELLLVIATIALVPAIVEEIHFRGLVQRSFEKGLGKYNGIVLTGIIFGLYHLNPFALVPLAVLGVYLGFLAMRANNLWVSVVAHFVNNTIACVAVYIQQDDDAVVTGSVHSMSVPMLLGTFWFFGVIFLLSTYYFIHITKPGQELPSAQ
ncbi:MAG TPA: CPBP family intramembrane glutamic endopeptidase [Bacteroidota bacterium]|jgi:membrane protease YdiL (CAAX protease family)|nr:CPBP family intramembrane glutamic endopeptidase [Bacteroidota bacterium]